MKQEMENQNPATGEPEEAVDAAANAEPVEAEPAQDAGASEVEALKLAAEEHYQRYLRTQADFDNFRRRARTEKEEFAKYASQKLIEGLLPIVDNFDRAVAASREQRDFESLAKGVEMIQRQLAALLEGEGLKAIEAVGQPFNPELHQAIMQVPAEEGGASGIVVEELQKGYMLKEKVIRPSMVKVTE
ncbi:nucleotide exchange factor GrpE [Paenibacillus sp.]|uniref:nucleotide exchange factor GrpE n=1 Tax=Paenibacillus sp. TaxID=58172 RepID=UPI002D4D8969|nr:nucleotide exchange factor GrpE [Paenibacillus sp.]HZG57380.1 nucleotide exchange factor GrpE [Paenibacillus sp.]